MQPHGTNTGTMNAQHSIFNDVQGSQYNYHYHQGHSDNAALETLAGLNVADARYDSRRRSSQPCDSGTRTDIQAKAGAWASDANESSVFWLHGKAGTGKSAIAQSISRTIEESGQLAASFFFSRDDEKCSSAEYIVATIAYQLTESIPGLRRLVCDALKNDILEKQIEEQWRKLVVEPLQLVPESDYPRIIVIDALDECTHPEQLKVLTRSTSYRRFPLRFFITSRLEPHIRPLFLDEGIISSSYDLQDFVPDDDIRLFLERRLGDIRQQRDGVMPDIPLLWPTAEEVDAIVKKSSGLFIYASTAVRYIANRYATPQAQLEIVLKDGNGGFSTDLDQLYQQVLSAACTTLHDLQSVIGAILFLRNPLNLRELACLLEINLDDLMQVLESLHSILSIPEDHNDARPVTAFHSSLYECLTSKDRAGAFFIDRSLEHAALVKNCLNHIKKISSNNFEYIFRYPSNYRWIIKQRFKLCSDTEQAVIRYSCRYWSFHLSKTTRTPNDFSPMKQFVTCDLIAWSILLLLDAQPRMETAREREWEQTRESEQEQVALTDTRRWRTSLQTLIFATLALMLAFLSFIVIYKIYRRQPIVKIVLIILALLVPLSYGACGVALLSQQIVTFELSRAPQDVKICMSQANPWISIRFHRIYQNIVLGWALHSARRFRKHLPVGDNPPPRNVLFEREPLLA